MEGFSNTVIFWLFGNFAFGGPGGTISPLTVFASIFAAVGLAMFGLLGAWAVFLGIFRLRNNGNFFGARDGNESFFYPLRMVAAMALCAPVIPIAQFGSESITLTPGHSLIAGIAKSASAFGDEAQGQSFRLMNKANLFGARQFLVQVDATATKSMLESWVAPASHLAAKAVFADPTQELKGVTPAQLAQAALELNWNKSNPTEQIPYSLEPAKIHVLDKMGVQAPAIPPTDALARAQANGVSRSLVDGTVDEEMRSEGWMCSNETGWMSTTFCSNEYASVKRNNAASIAAGLAAAQRQMWVSMVEHPYSRAAWLQDQNTGLTPEIDREIRELQTAAISAWVKHYTQLAQTLIRTTLATDQAARQDPYFEEVQKWGWMLGGTFVLRAAADFSRSAGYAESATAQMMPQSRLSDLTTSDSLSKMVEQGSLEAIQPGGEDGRSLYQKLFSLDFFSEAVQGSAGPGNQNIHNIAAWGRALVGTGIGIWSGGQVMEALSSRFALMKVVGLDGSMMKPAGVLMILLGALLGYVMPTLFAVYGIMGAISWLTAVASAFFGVTLWAAGMAAPKGEEHSSQLSAKGWNTLVFIGFYPALAVGGLAAAIVISSIGLSIVTMFSMGIWGMYDPGVSEAGRPLESMGGVIVGGLVMLIITVMLAWNVVVVSAQLITQFPRSVLNMVAISEPGLNPYENAPQGLSGSISGFIKTPIDAVVRQRVGGMLNRATQAPSSDRAGGN
ncbi:TPA: hypothetical protein ACRMZW_004321 [Pseudomonas aeruginosa]